MKKLFMLLILFGAFTIFPATSKAMLELDDFRNPITRDIKEDEVTALSLPQDSGTSSGSNSGSTDIMTPEEKAHLLEDGNTSSDLDIPVSSTDATNANDIIADDAKDIYTITGSENPELYNASESSEKNNINLLHITISSVSGLSIGSIATYLFLKKRR